jgi:hypothetical protein
MMSGCASTHHNLSFGIYVSKKLSIVERFRLPFNSFVMGMEMEIAQDSTFTFESCGSVGKGVWKVQEDSLILKFTSFTSKLDSSKILRTQIAYKIESNSELHRTIDLKKGTNILKVHDVLIKY